MRNKKLDERIQEYLDKQFMDVKGTQQLFDMKEELFINLKERISDMIKEGYTEEDAFKKGVISIGDLSDLVEEMQSYGLDEMKQSIDSKEAQHMSTKGMIGGILVFLFGIFASSIANYVLGSQLFLITSCLFTVPGMLLIIYGLLIKETRKRYAMNKTRAKRYILAIGTFLYGLCISIIIYSIPLELVALVLFMVSSLTSLAILLPLLLAGRSRLKNRRIYGINEFKHKALKFSIVGIGIILVLGGLGLFLANKGLIGQAKQVAKNPINFKEVDTILLTTHIPEGHEAIWNQLQEYEEQKDVRISMLNLIDVRSQQTREINTKTYSPFFHASNYSESKVPIKVTLYKNHEVKYEKTLQPGDMFAINEQLGRGKYSLKLECIGQGYCKGKGAITAGDINWD
ncbi:permease prefix domain 1-containing protein [Bacillus toyonensis]|uniref:permease prefix domain 1-containing protein n=1 Tax=Bacillus toyonensis TaxID=155322 RepID=UPI00211D9483|nr:permease prefix domain 1-containing protein [Bacillus toyonensis]